MNPTGNRYQIDHKKIVIFGAGKIGRSFIGQLFGRSGYKLVFVDADPAVVERLNKIKSYRIIIKGQSDEEIVVTNLEAVSAFEVSTVAESVATAGIIAVSVGQKALEKVVPVIAEGLKIRYSVAPDLPLDIILAENMRSASELVKCELVKYLPAGFPVENYVGLIETSIGKMVPIMPLAELEKDPLVIFAEPYNTLILDAKAFKTPIPDVKGLAPKSNIKAWVDRKAFIHNLGHATAAYYGYYLYPEAVYMYEILDHIEVKEFTRNVMLQSADILQIVYRDDFPAGELEKHIDDLIFRFRNKALRDTIFRVGQDLGRKLSIDDRFMGAIHLAIRHNMPYDRIIKAMSFGLYFNAKDESGKSYQPDIDFLNSIKNSFENTLINNLGLDPVLDQTVILQLKRYFTGDAKLF